MPPRCEQKRMLVDSPLQCWPDGAHLLTLGDCLGTKEGDIVPWGPILESHHAPVYIYAVKRFGPNRVILHDV